MKGGIIKGSIIKPRFVKKKGEVSGNAWSYVQFKGYMALHKITWEAMR